MAVIVSKAQFARMAGVSGAAITKAVGTKRLNHAVVGKRIDASHADAVAYLDAQGRGGLDVTAPSLGSETDIISTKVPERSPDTRGAGVKKEKKKHEGELSPDADLPGEIYDLLDLSFREILDRYGTEARFVDVLSAGQKVESIKSSRVKTAQSEGKLISRVLVKNGVIDVFNSAHLRLMKDGAKSIAAGAISKHSSGASATEVEAYVSDILGSFIKPIKSKIVRTLKNV